MKKLFLSTALLVIGFLNAQVKIGNNPTSLNAASLFRVRVNYARVLLPIMNNDQIA